MVMNTTFGDGFIYEQGADAAPGLTTNVQVEIKHVYFPILNVLKLSDSI